MINSRSEFIVGFVPSNHPRLIDSSRRTPNVVILSAVQNLCICSCRCSLSSNSNQSVILSEGAHSLTVSAEPKDPDTLDTTQTLRTFQPPKHRLCF